MFLRKQFHNKFWLLQSKLHSALPQLQRSMSDQKHKQIFCEIIESFSDKCVWVCVWWGASIINGENVQFRKFVHSFTCDIHKFNFESYAFILPNNSTTGFFLCPEFSLLIHVVVSTRKAKYTHLSIFTLFLKNSNLLLTMQLISIILEIKEVMWSFLI